MKKYNRMNNFFYIVFLVCMSIASCKQTPIEESEMNRNGDITIIKPDFSNPVFDITDLIDSIRYVKLELTEKSLIGDLTKIIIYEDKIYVLDTKTSSLFIFAMDGKYLSKIHHVGPGPEEYIQLDFFTIDKEQRQIILTDLVGYWVMRYSFSGNFISRQKIPFWIRDIAPISNGGFVFYMNYANNEKKVENEFNFLYTDSLLQVEKAYFPYRSAKIGMAERKFSTPSEGVFFDYHDCFYFVTAYNDTIYQVDPEGLTPRYAFDFEDKKNDPTVFDTNEDNILKYLEKNEFRSVSHFYENDDLINFETLYQGQLWTGFYNKKNGHIINSIIFRNGDVGFFIRNLYMYKGWHVGCMSIDMLLSEKEWIDKRTSKEEVGREQYIELLNNISDEDNTVLRFYKLKDF